MHEQLLIEIRLRLRIAEDAVKRWKESMAARPLVSTARQLAFHEGYAKALREVINEATTPATLGQEEPNHDV